MIHYRILVKGKVQGVWFRKFTKENADALGVKGWVKNTRDGNVYIEAEAELEAMKQFIERVKKGSPESKVEEVDLTIGDVQNFSKFEIVYH